MNQTAEIYQSGNQFQNRIYRKMAEYLNLKGVIEFGRAKKNGALYRHLLPSDSTYENFLFDNEIYLATKTRFQKGKAGDWHRAKTNTAASQPCCFNLFVPLQQDLELASRLFSSLMEAAVVVSHVEIEFTPNCRDLHNLPGYEVGLKQDESIGDQGTNQGTDADVAVFYTASGKKGIILIEFKYIESEFSMCTSFRKKPKELMRCSNAGYFKSMIEDELMINGACACGYLKYKNWQLSKYSDILDIDKIRDMPRCPFRFSLNQLWRNLLMAEAVKRARNLDECQFWVISPAENTKLWDNHNEKVEDSFRNILTKSGLRQFMSYNLHDVVNELENIHLSSVQQKWAISFREKYLSF